MNIVHCIWSFMTGGSETMLVDIVNEQARRGENVTLIVVNDKYDADLVGRISPDVNTILLRRPEGSHNPVHIIKFNRLLRKLHPDVIHIHKPSLTSIIFGLKKKPMVLTVHCLNLPTKGMERMDCIAAISKAVERDIKERGVETKTRVINNGIATSLIKKRSRREPREVVKVVQVGRLDKDLKGQDILIETMALLRKDGVPVTATIIGEGPSRDELESLATKLGVEKYIEFAGLRDREYIYSHLADYDIMCHPSRFEGFGLTVAEGMVAGLPVVVADGDGPYEITDRGRLGTAFKNGDVNACAAAIKRVVENYQAALDVAEEAAEHAIKNFSLSHQVDRYRDLYESVIRK